MLIHVVRTLYAFASVFLYAMVLGLSAKTIGLCRISAPANSESGNFSEIRTAKFLTGFAGFGGCQCSCSTISKLPIKVKQPTCEVVYSQF